MRMAMKEIVQVTPRRLRLFQTSRPAFCGRRIRHEEGRTNFDLLAAVLEIYRARNHQVSDQSSEENKTTPAGSSSTPCP
eukprot:42481-Hanusia_phi.AAC.3